MALTIKHLENGTTEIITERLRLRAAEDGDAEALHECFKDPEVMRYWSTSPHETIEQTQKWLHAMTHSLATNGISEFAITLLSSGAFIGKMGLFRPLDANGSAEIGFLLATSAQGKGYASETLSAILSYLFELEYENLNQKESAKCEKLDADSNHTDPKIEDEGNMGKLKLAEITADIDPRNMASLRLLQKHGFVETGFAEKTWEVAGEWVDSTYMALRREAWEEQFKAKKKSAEAMSQSPTGERMKIVIH